MRRGLTGAGKNLARPMPDLDTRGAGDGPNQTAMWLDGVPIMLTDQ